MVEHPSTYSITLYAKKLRTNFFRQNEMMYGDEPIAAITFCHVGHSSILITLCATRDSVYDKEFGQGNDNRSFRGRGILSLLVKLASSVHHSKFENSPFLFVYATMYATDPTRTIIWQPHGFVLESRSLFQSLLSYAEGQEEFPTGDTLPVIGDELVYISPVGKHNMLAVHYQR